MTLMNCLDAYRQELSVRERAEATISNISMMSGHSSLGAGSTVRKI